MKEEEEGDEKGSEDPLFGNSKVEDPLFKEAEDDNNNTLFKSEEATKKKKRRKKKK
jgi:hypothetical protein